MKFDYIIVQAGGEGLRLRPLTQNRPKCLVSVQNRPILFHLFEEYPTKKFIIIGDYKYDVLSRYLERYATVPYLLLHSREKGNIAGLRQALARIPADAPFLLIWSDLLLADDFDTEGLDTGCYIGTTDHFPCSWRYEQGVLEKRTTEHHGVAGAFLFDKKQRLQDVPEGGSFTRYLKTSGLPLRALDMGTTEETGTLERVKQLDTKENRCRPYNKMTFSADRVVKEGLTPDAKKLIDRELAWYKTLQSYDYKGIPAIFSDAPLTMARIDGDNIFKAGIRDADKKAVLARLCQRLDEMHRLVERPFDAFDIWEECYGKTLRRLRTIESVIPFANEPEITIQGKRCINILQQPSFLQAATERIMTPSPFGILHGDCTLTNTLIDRAGDIYFIDARGYFGHTALVGDVYYDWAKVYYSIAGAFDQFNIGNFALTIGEDRVSYTIHPSGWEYLTDELLSMIPDCDLYRLRLYHAVIWLSLASHCSDDYDALCLAFYNGLYLLNTLEG